MKKFDKKNAIDFIKRNKIPLLILLVVIIALIIGLVVSSNIGKESDNITKKEPEEGMTANTNAGIVQDATYQGLKFSNISLISENGYSTFSADVTNTNATDSNIADVNIILKDKDGNEVITLRR